MINDDKFPDIYSAGGSIATLVPMRNPKFKVHNNFGEAHLAVANKKPEYEVAIYAIKNGDWVKTWEYRFGGLCRCGNELKTVNLDPKFEGIVKDAPVICYDCFEAIEESERQLRQRAIELKQLVDLQRKYRTVQNVDLPD